MTKIIAVIPAHLASIRFPRKILFPFHGLIMIEHVRRRALLSDHISNVFVATCDEEIADAVREKGGDVIMTSNTHTNGTSRVAEAVKDIDCSHIILLQGDEPLLLPRHVSELSKNIIHDPECPSFNVTGPIINEDELDRHSFVKCSVSTENKILYCFRRSPSTASFEEQKNYIRKILGIIAYRKDFLLEITKQKSSRVEKYEFIEQMRIIETGHRMKSVPVVESLPSVNEPHEAEEVLDYIKTNEEQASLLKKILI